MSISTTTRKAGPYAGNDVQTTFAFAFKVFTDEDVVATRGDGTDETTLVLGVDYTVTLNGDQDNAPGGDVVLSSPLASDLSLTITSGVQALQPVTVTNGGGFFPAVFNGVFDRLTILVQQLAEKLGRTFTVPLTAQGVTNLQIPVTPLAVLQWSADGSQLLALELPDLAASVAYPDQAGKAGQFLTTNGSIVSWGPAVASVAGLEGEITADALTTALALAVGDVSGAAPIASPAFTGSGGIAAGWSVGTSLAVGTTLTVTGAASMQGALTVTGLATLLGGVKFTGGTKDTVAALSGTDIDFSTSNCRTKSISANTAFTVSGLEAGQLQIVYLILTISSGADPSFPAAFKFEGGVNFLSSLENGTHWLTIATHDGGTSGVIGLLYRNVL